MTQKLGSFVLRSASVADHSVRAAVGTSYTVPKGFGGHIVKVKAFAFNEAFDTDVPTGGLVELENGSIDWKPFKFYTHSQEILTTTGTSGHLTEIDCDLPLPDNSVVTAYYTATNAATDVIMIECVVEMGVGARNQTFMDAKKSAAITNAYTTTAKACTFDAVAATKGGRLRKVLIEFLGSPETALTEGGMAEFYSNSWQGPYIQVIVGGMTGKTTMAGEHYNVQHDVDADLPDNSIVYVDVTPVDNQSSLACAGIMWTRR